MYMGKCLSSLSAIRYARTYVWQYSCFNTVFVCYLQCFFSCGCLCVLSSSSQKHTSHETTCILHKGACLSVYSGWILFVRCTQMTAILSGEVVIRLDLKHLSFKSFGTIQKFDSLYMYIGRKPQVIVRPNQKLDPPCQIFRQMCNQCCCHWCAT